MTVATVTAMVASAQEAAATSAVAAAVLAEDHVVDSDQAAVEVVAVVKIKVWLLKKLINTRFLLNT